MEREAKGVSKTINPLCTLLTKPSTQAQSCVLLKERMAFLVFTKPPYQPVAALCVRGLGGRGRGLVGSF